jgi:hypothetical protein
VLDGVTYPSTLDASRLKIVIRSIESDSESTSETKKTRLLFLRKCTRNLKKLRIEFSDFQRKKPVSQRISGEKCNFPGPSILAVKRCPER